MLDRPSVYPKHNARTRGGDLSLLARLKDEPPPINSLKPGRQPRDAFAIIHQQLTKKASQPGAAG